MQVAGAGTHYIVYNSRSDVLSLTVFADGHEGARGARTDKLDRDIAAIRDDPNAYWLHLGDYADFISTSDRRRFDPAVLDPTIPIEAMGYLGKYLVTRVRDRFAPIAHKCIGIGYGNHEWYYMKEEEQQDLHGWLCQELGVPNFGYCFITDVAFIRCSRGKPGLYRERPYKKGGQTWTRRIFGHHGASCAQTPGGRIKHIDDAMHQYNADIYLLAHVHGQAVAPPHVVLGANHDCSRIQPYYKLGAITGSYLETYPEGAGAGYGERRMYRPSHLGAIKVYFEPDKRKAWIPTVVQWEDAT